MSLHLQSPTEKRIPIIQDSTAAAATTATASTNNQDSPNTIAEWEANDEFMIVVLYSRVVLEQNNSGLGMNWIQQSLLPDLMKEFRIFEQSLQINKKDDELSMLDECHLFNASFNAIYKKCESKARDDKMNYNYSTAAFHDNNKNTKSTDNVGSILSKTKKKKGKEARVWHDSEQKVTSKTMSKLDRSKKDDRVNEGDDPLFISDSSPTLIEARAAYLPSDNEIPSWEQEDELVDDDNDNLTTNDKQSGGWGSSLKGMMGQFSGKLLTDEDLDAPLQDMEKMLTGKNVAREIAQDICATVRKKLIGKRMTSFTRVKTAVRQALEISIEKILRPGKGRGGGEEIDLLRNVVSKRENGMMGSLFGSSNSGGKRPYVIVMGKSFVLKLPDQIFLNISYICVL